MKHPWAFACLPLALATLPGLAQTAPLDEARAAYFAAWSAAPLSIGRMDFVNEPASAYGMVQKRSSSIFASDEPIYIYVEPLGYGWKPDGDANAFGLDIGLRVLSSQGAELFSDEDFIKLVARSKSQPTEFYGNITLNLTGIERGAYTLEFRLRDVASDEATTATMPFKVE
jgi:hypothetical protein